jgi:hypothetical protein
MTIVGCDLRDAFEEPQGKVERSRTMKTLVISAIGGLTFVSGLVAALVARD